MARILVVDDDPVFSVQLEQLVLSEGHSPVMANSAVTALGVLTAGTRVDLIVTDLMMPHVGGFDLIRTLRAFYPSLPIIAISSGDRDGGTDMLAEARELVGAECVTTKQGVTVVLGVLIHRVLSRTASARVA